MQEKFKFCSKCGKELPLDEFSKSSSTKDGHLNICKRCRGTIKTDTPEILHCPVCNNDLPYWQFKIASHSHTGR